VFCQLGHVQREEALVYLDAAGWQFERAVAQLREDREWELRQSIRCALRWRRRRRACG
jgi:hypothetical protein